MGKGRIDRSKTTPVEWGPVYITAGRHKGRIGYYDDDDFLDDGKTEGAIVYFGEFFVARGYCLIPTTFISEVTTHSLMNRRQELRDAISPLRDRTLKGDKRAEALEELNYVDSLLAARMFTARLTEASKPCRIFISYSSRDEVKARWISVDLKNCGYKVWFDEWNITVGEIIPSKISKGLDECDFVAVLLSKHAVGSKWVENEWHAKYWEEVREGKIKVLPILIEDCRIPALLRTKKYADFRDDYGRGLEDLMAAIKSLSVTRTKKRRKVDSTRNSSCAF